MDFKKELDNKYLIVDFYADWCKPCKEFEPTFEKYRAEYPSFNFLKVNVDENDDIAAEYNVVKVPTIIFFIEGTERYRLNGCDDTMAREYLKNMSNKDDIELLSDF